LNDPVLLLQLALMAMLLLGSGFFSGSETALFGLSRLRRKALERRGEGAAARVLELLRQPRLLLITILIGNTFVNVALSALGTTVADRLVGGGRGLGVAIAVVTLLLLVVGEVLPKVLAVRYGETFSLTVAPALDRFRRLVAPLTRAFEAITQALLRRLPRQDARENLDEGELVTLLKIGAERGEIQTGEADLVKGILALRGTEAREVMTPRVELHALRWEPPPEDLAASIRRLGHQRVPVYGEDIDDLRGVLEARAFLLAGREALPEDFLARPYMIPEGKKLADLLEDFRSRGVQVAIVLDEYGGVSGLITLEDVLEEIFGEVFDPGDEVEVRPTEDGFRILGKASLEDVGETLGIDFEEDEEDEVATVGGFVMSQLGRLPRRGDVATYEGWNFRVAHVLRRRVMAVEVLPVPGQSFGEAM
jgi:CBS domain containing-hemolysin-like protein